MGPLHGVRIIDMTTVVMGPYATRILGDYGADVIKVEAPGGDLVRKIAPARHEGMGPLYLNSNRSKRSIVLDLKRSEGRQALLRLCAGADALVYNIRPAAMRRLGLSYEEIAASNPKIIYAGMFGFGQKGPYAARPAYDDLIQGGAALPHLFMRAGGDIPRYVPSAISDRIVGIIAVSAIIASLFERERSGCGQQVDIPMFESMVEFVLCDHLGGLTFIPPLDDGGYARHLSPDRRPYRTMDGHICAMLYSDDHWKRFFTAIGTPTMLETDPRFRDFSTRMAHIDEVYGELSRIFQTRTSAEWLALLEQADVPAMPMHDLRSVLGDPHLEASRFFHEVEHPTEGPIRSMAVPVAWSRTPAEPARYAPRLGEHSEEILREAGFTGTEIKRLADAGVTGSMPAARQLRMSTG